MEDSYKKTLTLTCTCGAALQGDDDTDEISCPVCGKTFKNIDEVYELPHIKKMIEREQEKLLNKVQISLPAPNSLNNEIQFT